jgi:hypothetical protein
MTTALRPPRLPAYSGVPIISGQPLPCLSGDLPADFPQRLARLKEASGLTWEDLAWVLGVELKQVLRWQNGTEPCGGAYHCLVLLAARIRGGLSILMGDDFPTPQGRE